MEEDEEELPPGVEGVAELRLSGELILEIPSDVPRIPYPGSCSPRLISAVSRGPTLTPRPRRDGETSTATYITALVSYHSVLSSLLCPFFPRFSSSLNWREGTRIPEVFMLPVYVLSAPSCLEDGTGDLQNSELCAGPKLVVTKHHGEYHSGPRKYWANLVRADWAFGGLWALTLGHFMNLKGILCSR